MSAVKATAPTIKTLARIDAYDVRFVDIFGDYVTWTSGDSKGQQHNRAMLHDLRTGKTTIAARTTKANSAIEWSRGSRETLVFTEQDYGADRESDPAAAWRIMALDLASGKRDVLDRDQDPSEREFNPIVEIDWPWVAWGRPTKAENRYDLVVFNLESSQRTTMLRETDFADLHVVDTTVVYTAPSAAGRDLFAIDLPATGAAPRRLTTSGQVQRVGKAGGELVGYEEPLNTDPQRLLVVPVKGGTPIAIRNAVTGGNVVTGNGFAAWYGQLGSVEVSAIAPSAEAVTVLAKNASVPTRLSADRTRLVWGEMTKGDADIFATAIVVAEVG